MAVKTKEEVVQDVVGHIDRTGGEYSLWYIGMANNDPKSILFDQHNVSRVNGKWIYRTMETSREAKEVVISLTNLGLKPLTTREEKIVYAYRKTDSTTP